MVCCGRATFECGDRAQILHWKRGGQSLGLCLQRRLPQRVGPFTTDGSQACLLLLGQIGRIGEYRLDLGLRLGEGSGALAAVPLVRSAALLLRDVALLSEVLG